MTNKEALLAAVGLEVSDIIIEKALTDNAVDGALTYTAANKDLIKFAQIQVLQSVINSADITEGDMSVKYDRGAILKLLAILTAPTPTEVETLKPTLRSRANMW